MGNDFWWKIFFQDLKSVSTTQLSLASTQKECTQQLRGFYINSVRGNRIRPLDQDSLVHLQSVNSSYDDLSITGWFFICSWLSNSVVWYIQHIRSGEIYSLIAGLAYDFYSNTYLPSFQAGWNFLFENAATSWYLRDSYGGIAQISWSGLSIGSVCGNGIKESGEQCDFADSSHMSRWTASPGCTSSCQIANLSAWGGGWSYQSKDVCPENKDCSSSYYDGLCWTCIVAPIKTGVVITIPQFVHTSPTISWNITDSPYSQELNQAYKRAYSMWMTTLPTIQRANLTGNLVRKYAAKMMSQFAIQVLWRVPNNLVSCNFTDITGENLEVQYYVRLACKLGLMWLKADGTPSIKFYPNNRVTRAQFGTMLSRVLYGDLYNRSTGRYGGHLQALKDTGIMNNITNPLMLELRWYVMLMLMRASEK